MRERRVGIVDRRAGTVGYTVREREEMQSQWDRQAQWYGGTDKQAKAGTVEQTDWETFTVVQWDGQEKTEEGTVGQTVRDRQERQS